ncbi:cellulose binding domain-containing protein [Lentzea sp. CC55]|uniref:cellulose binding domain-containing protein n=1 Tax=Lentzea sp. CC55 TaxID=2884909 RepID=UPI0027DFF2FA|nr:cellulose binding domain-containing protein [Lentzea sp. CC55]MCG8925540.1 cellulose-binding domain-containing protein [Lentzea sp. CC55]
MTAGATAISGWQVDWTFANGERINSSWNATLTTSGSTITARNAAHNGIVGAGASTTFGFVASGTAGTPTPPAPRPDPVPVLGVVGVVEPFAGLGVPGQHVGDGVSA